MDAQGRHGPVGMVLFDNTVSGVTITLYMIFAIFSCAYSFRMTTRPGMSSSIRKEFIWRHIMYVLVYIICWLPYLGLTFYTVYACQLYIAEGVAVIDGSTVDSYTTHIRKWWNFNNATSCFTGLLMASIRV